MGWALRHQTRSWCGARLCGPLNISHPCSSPEQAHAGHSQPLIGSGRLGLAVGCRDNDVAHGLTEACQTVARQSGHTRPCRCAFRVAFLFHLVLFVCSSATLAVVAVRLVSIL